MKRIAASDVDALRVVEIVATFKLDSLIAVTNDDKQHMDPCGHCLHESCLLSRHTSKAPCFLSQNAQFQDPLSTFLVNATL